MTNRPALDAVRVTFLGRSHPVYHGIVLGVALYVAVTVTCILRRQRTT